MCTDLVPDKRYTFVEDKLQLQMMEPRIRNRL